MDKYVIRTSDRGTWRKCRELWNFKSPLRRRLQPLAGPKPLEFGIAVHRGLQVYYDPEMWDFTNRAVVEALALKAFNEDCNTQELKRKESGLWDDLVQEDFADRRELGEGMLKHYFAWAPEQDKDWRPVHTEITFEVPVAPPYMGTGYWSTDEPYQKGLDVDDSSGEPVLLYQGKPVVYQGRLDAVMQHKDGTYWIWDHKTAAQFRENLDWLDMDPQVGSYAWALYYRLGIEIEGVIYNELRKTVPKLPKELKNGGFSQNKQQDTTYEVYKRHLEGAGESLVQYKEMLDHLREKGNRFFRRTPVHRTPKELEIIGNNIALEAIDMLNNPSIYPNPNPFNCYDCAFKTPCLTKQEGSDPEFLLQDAGIYEVQEVST